MPSDPLLVRAAARSLGQGSQGPGTFPSPVRQSRVQGGAGRAALCPEGRRETDRKRRAEAAAKQHALVTLTKLLPFASGPWLTWFTRKSLINTAIWVENSGFFNFTGMRTAQGSLEARWLGQASRPASMSVVLTTGRQCPEPLPTPPLGSHGSYCYHLRFTNEGTEGARQKGET